MYHIKTPLERQLIFFISHAKPHLTVRGLHNKPKCMVPLNVGLKLALATKQIILRTDSLRCLTSIFINLVTPYFELPYHTTRHLQLISLQSIDVVVVDIPDQVE
jgi:hypothetical protein